MTDALVKKRAKKKGISFDEATESFVKEKRSTPDLRRRREVDEVAAAVLLLCSRQASFIIGANLRIDGGSVAAVLVTMSKSTVGGNFPERRQR